MLALLVASSLLAGPPSGAVAVAWRGAEAPDERTRAAVREAVAAVDGRPPALVLDAALERARVAVSRELPATIRTSSRELRAALDDADAAYREGRFADARSQLDALLAALEARPDLPGAAASAREAHLLAARIAWAQGDVGGAEQALGDALRLDPEARLSARRAPPELVARYEALQATLLASRERWVTPRIVVDGLREPVEGVSVEIDGVLGSRPVPPGPHFVVVYRDGHEPSASWRPLDQPWEVPGAVERISTDPDANHQAICDALALELLLLAERRGGELGLQGYRCGVGYGPLWTGKREGLATGVATILAGPFAAAAPSLAATWTTTPIPDLDPGPGPEPEPTRPWYRKGWIWGTGAGVAAIVAGSVAAGVLLSGRGSPASLEIDADQFIGTR